MPQTRSQSAKKSKGVGKRRKPPAPLPLPPPPPRSNAVRTTNPTGIEELDMSLVHCNLREAWKIHKANPTCFIFDFVCPARPSDAPTPIHNPPPHEELMEVDEDDGLAEYVPPRVRARRYGIQCQFNIEPFVQWEQDEVAEVTVCKRFNVRNQNSTHIRTKEVKIPVAYIRVIDMFNKLQEHGITNPSDEAQRRSSYAERMLEELGKEIWSANVIGKDFCSMVLNPVMQRHRLGVPADYTRVVKRVVSGVREPTIRDATVFYLGTDPVDPAIINSYRRNILYISEARWHLCVVLGVIAISNPCTFHEVHANTDTIFLDLQKNPAGPTKHDLCGVPAYTAMEVNVILHEGLDEFFRDELDIDPQLHKQVAEKYGSDVPSGPLTPTSNDN